jgi:hypothetical protein
MELNIVVFLLFLQREHLRLSRVFLSALKQPVNSVAQPCHMVIVSRIAGLCFDIKRCGIFVVFA